MWISLILFWGYKYSQGKCHYIHYIKSTAYAGLFGFFYSVYFNDEKLTEHMA